MYRESNFDADVLDTISTTTLDAIEPDEVDRLFGVASSG